MNPLRVSCDTCGAGVGQWCYVLWLYPCGPFYGQKMPLEQLHSGRIRKAEVKALKWATYSSCQ